MSTEHKTTVTETIDDMAGSGGNPLRLAFAEVAMRANRGDETTGVKYERATVQWPGGPFACGLLTAPDGKQIASGINGGRYAASAGGDVFHVRKEGDTYVADGVFDPSDEADRYFLQFVLRLMHQDLSRHLSAVSADAV